jgi:hypothetical protein
MHEMERSRSGGAYFTFWKINRIYTQSELSSAKLLLLQITNCFEPCGEECGTIYDEDSACKICLSGAKQTSPLFLNLKKIPARCDIARTIAGEIVVSSKFVRAAERLNTNCLELAPVFHTNTSGTPSSEWFQPIVKSPPIAVHSSTAFGSTPFDTERYGSCPNGDLLGLRRLTEVCIERIEDYGTQGFFKSRQFFGARQGLLRPSNLWFLSSAMFRLMKEENVRGFDVEVCHLR